MSVQTVGRDLIVLEGDCPSEDAERLLQRLLATPDATVDVRHCLRLHSAVIQVLLAAQPMLRLPKGDTDLENCLRAQLMSVITR